MKLEGRNLQINMRGDDVRRLQTELNQLGFTLGVNGFFDSMTYLAVRQFQQEHGLEINGVVDEETARRINAEVDALTAPPFIVKGQVRQADGDPADGVLISAFDVDLRSEELLGQTQTDRKGFYQIQYSAEQFSKREKGKADLVVKVLSTNDVVLVASPISFNAPAVAEIDLTIPAKVLRRLPLFDKIRRELAPLLGNLRAEDLEENQEHQDLTFLSGETGVAKDTLARFVLAHKLLPQGIQAEFWFVLLGSSFYEYTEEQSLAEQLTAILEALPSLNAIAVRKALIRGFNEKEIAETFQANVTEWIDAFLTLVARREVTATDKVTFVKAALEDARIQSTEKQIKFARLFNQYRALTPELLEELRQDSSFTPTEIADLDTSFQLADLTRGDFSVVKMLKQEFNVRQPEQIRTLAKRSENEWVNLVRAKHVAGEIKLPIEIDAIAPEAKLPEAEIYGKMLDRQFREAFPTTAFTGGLERALRNGGSQGLRRARDLNRFLERHTSFEFLNTPVDKFLQESIDREFRELAQDRDFRREVKAVQRVFKLAPTFEATDTLLADDLHSAQKVYRMGESEFVRRYGTRSGFTPETARLAWNRAADTHAAVLTIVADLKALEAEALPMALKNNSDALSSFPNWNNLFKTGDLCECEHCRSVLSPAAYFADLLMFLKDRETHTGNGKVKDVLFRRRPDLGFLELNCDNALVPLPYIDVVCEVLEAAIDSRGENDLELTGFTAMQADLVAAQTAVMEAFQAAFNNSINDGKQKIELGSNFSLSQVATPPSNRWVVHTDDATYLLQKKPAFPHFFAAILRNTKASADELRAYPQYVNPKAYETLRQARYPFTLPFDLFAEEVRAAFQKTNLQRWDLMRTFRGAAEPNNPTDSDIAAEYFGIGSSVEPTDPSEKTLILDAVPEQQQEIWGEAQNADWLETYSDINDIIDRSVCNVRYFLQKTGLEYTELLALLDLKFINPAGDIFIQHLDTSCDTDKKVIQGLDATKLDRIHRFLRLWRKLKTWKMWELDLVIRHPRIGNGVLNEAFLVNLFYFSELKKKLGGKTTVEQVCAFFDNLNTETHFTKLHEKREEGFYQSLFLNKRLINPLDLAFQLDPVTGNLPIGETITDHHPVVLATLGLREADLILLKQLTKASDGTHYITDDLTLINLSFLWRHAWLSKMLKFKVEEWVIILKIFQQDIQEFANPQAAWEFLEKIDRLKATGFKPDELNWLLTGDRTAKAAVKETDALRFLTTLRKDLQTIQAEITVTLPTDADQLTALLTALLQKLNRDEAEAEAFISIVKSGETVGSTPAELLVKFYEPKFSASLTQLPASIDFATQLSNELATKIAYDPEQRLLQFTGIMNGTEQTALLTLSEDAAYVAAVNSLATQPQTITLPDERIWLTDADLDATQPANDTEVKRLTSAIVKALGYLSKTLTENAIVQQSSIQLGLTEAITRRLLTEYPILPDSLLMHLSGNYALDAITLNGWYWASRVATLLKTWKITLAEWEKITALTAEAQLLDFQTLPLDDTGAIAPLDRFLRSSRLLKLRDSLPETEITVLEVLENLNAGTYATAADFAFDLERLNEDWIAADVEALIASLDLTYPTDYLLAESWERLQRAFYFLDNLNAGTDTVKRFAAAAMGFDDATTLKELLRSKFGTETWLTLSTEIQDVLRERKRDALAAYLLTQPKPDDAPSGKWENTNDLYAYYLLDVEMSSCQLTSRLVQGSGSIQLFVQRCFMGLEPDVIVKADGDDGDSAWRWWKWMRKYRVWEANRKVFLWPENWIEPELKKDKSSFFKDLENELLQNEINQYTVETAFTNYLEKLDNVAQLEIAGFYQEDDGDNAIVHVFGRTTGAEPHLYYYRRYDYRQWTPWEKVDLDIQGDYLIPAVVNKRLFLFWPIFTEVPDETKNSMSVLIPSSGDTVAPVNKTYKRLKLQMAVSDYRQGKWSPKRVSKDFHESQPYTEEIDKKHYSFYSVDLTNVNGSFTINYHGFSVDKDANEKAELKGSFNISGCKGIPEKTYYLGTFKHIILPEQASVGVWVDGATEHVTRLMKWAEQEERQDGENDFALQNNFGLQQLAQILIQTPGLFRMSPPWQMSYLDKLLFNGQSVVGVRQVRSIGNWLPFFYNDQKRTFFVLPCFWQRDSFDSTGVSSGSGVRAYYPEIKNFIRQWEDLFQGQIEEWLENVVPGLTDSDRNQWEQFFYQQLDEEAMPPYTDEQFKNLARRWLMRFFHYYLGALSLKAFQFRQFHFKNFYHPFVCDFAKLVYNPLKGIPALMSRETQLKNTGFRFKQNYQPTNWVVEPTSETFYPQEMVDFTPDGAYSPYNWELFFHAPLLVANSLSKNQRFEEAREWYHFIFNPIGVESGVPEASPMSKYWITKPFFETTDPEYNQQRIDNLLRMLAGDTSITDFSAQLKKDLEDQVIDWRTNPFEPHRIANYRTVAYQKTVVMKYLDNLIAWGDYLFRQDSMESINEATQLYILAAEILGSRPKKVPPQAKPPLESFNELETEFDAFSNALVEVENLVPVLSGNSPDGSNSAPLPMLYFCIPQNDKMLGYWDTVADRLYKIRHCMNIEGVVRQLALFEPPIDPGALVKAVAGGVDISSALADLNAPLPLYRFNILLQKANEVCNDVKALGSALLAALEKKDAEAMGLLRQGQEIKLLEAVKAVREQQIEEAKENLEGVKRSKTTIEVRRDYYRDIEKLIAQENLHLAKMSEAHSLQEDAQGVKLSASIISLLPAIDLGVSGFGGTPIAKFKIGGLELGQAADLAAEVLSFLSQMASNDSSMAASEASFERRWEDWKLQERLAEKELDQIDKQISAAELRIAIAEKELENHVLQIENAKANDEFMRSKYTNEELYQWQIGQISGVYFQSYRLAYDLAKRAERCFRFELGLQDSSYIQFGYWDSLKKGLLSGEKLQYDLRRLENAYLEQNRREFELTKHVSLALLDPLALVQLRETGRCFVNLPEEIFDLDYPGHYFRRIKSVSITLPCVVGPYTTISCTLRLLKNSIRINTANGDNGYPRNTDDQGLPVTDDRFIENNIPVKAIAASNAQNDSGVFELNFRDERYLPFEGAGVISQWSLELFNDNSKDFGKALRQFDYSTITDIILHIKYMAREDAGSFKSGAIAHLQDYFSQDEAPSVRMFNLRQEFPSQWHRLLHPTNPVDGNIFELEMSPHLFPIRDRGKRLKVNTIWLLARCTDAGDYEVVTTFSDQKNDTMQLKRGTKYGGLHFAQTSSIAAKGIEIDPTANPPIKWQLSMTSPTDGNLQADPVTGIMEVEDVLLVLGYKWQ
jgi:hypothetical protein